jgi:hypothetical protein
MCPPMGNALMGAQIHPLTQGWLVTLLWQGAAQVVVEARLVVLVVYCNKGATLAVLATRAEQVEQVEQVERGWLRPAVKGENSPAPMSSLPTTAVRLWPNADVALMPFRWPSQCCSVSGPAGA